jgi:hypothetical protein
MASHETVARALAIMQELWSREITPELVRIYRAALADVDDDALLAAVRRALTTCKFFPVPAELRELAGANRPAFVDAEAVLDRIAGHASYHPASGTRMPRVEVVRQLLGDAVAEAYGLAGGGDRLFSPNETTRSIARREFAEELRQLVRERGSAALPSPKIPRLPAPVSDLVIYDEPPPRVHRGPQPIAAHLPAPTERAS